jgi:putative DNA primase/helicase
LDLPKVVTDATKEYRTESDVLGDFLSEELIVGPQRSVPSSALYVVYESWCKANGEYQMSSQALGRALTARGFVSAKAGKGGHRGWKGLGLPTSKDVSKRR